MNVTSKELCKELYELSGLNDTDYWYYDGSVDAYRGWVDHGTEFFPAYDLGYLLRKLPDEAGLQNPRIEKGVFVQKQSTTTSFMQYRAAYQYGKVRSQYAETPEDALCKLAIALFKANILVKGETK